MTKRLTLAVALLGAGMTAGQAVESESRPLPPVAGVELGARLTSQAAPALTLTHTSESPDSESTAAEAPKPRPERKVRVVYPLPR